MRQMKKKTSRILRLGDSASLNVFSYVDGITELFGYEGTLKTILSKPPAMGSDTFHYIRLLTACSCRINNFLAVFLAHL